MLLIRDSVQGQRHTQSEREGIRKNFMQIEKREGKSDNTYIRQNKL